MINWFNNMRRKQKESDKLLASHVIDKKIQLRNSAISLAKDYKNAIESIKISYKDIKIEYNITDEEVDAYVSGDEHGN